VSKNSQGLPNKKSGADTFVCFHLFTIRLLGLRVLPQVSDAGEEFEEKKGGVHMTFESEEFDPQAARRLFLAVVNQAISDVLENKNEAKAAEQWLLSEEFDDYAELLCWDAQGIHQQPAVA
jgi:hypothetical protein